MWMHFVIYCSMDLETSNSHRHAEAEIAAFAHPGYKYPLESTNNFIISSSPKCDQSSNLDTSHQQCFFWEGNLAVNPFTNVNRLDVFRNLSRGEGSQLLISRKESYRSSPSVSSSDCASAHGCSPAQISLDADAPTQLAYAFKQSRLQSCFSSDKFVMINSLRAISQPLHYGNSPTPCQGKNLSLISQSTDVQECNLMEQQRNSLASTSHPYFNNKASTASAIGLAGKATHLRRVLLSGVDHVTPFTSAGTAPVPLLLSHLEERKSFVWEMGKITSLNTDNCALMMEKRGPVDINRMIRRSLHDLIDVENTSSLFNNSPISLSGDDTELFGCDLAENSSYFLPVSDKTTERNSSLAVDMASSTDISNMGSYSPSSVSNILKGSFKNIRS